MDDDVYSRIENFIIPDKTISLKLVFDNIRNYGVVALVYLLSEWIRKSHTLDVSRQLVDLTMNSKQFHLVPIVIAGILLLFNIMQSYMIISWLVSPILDNIKSRGDESLEKSTVLGKTKQFVISLASLLLALAILTLVLKVLQAVLLFAIDAGGH